MAQFSNTEVKAAVSCKECPSLNDDILSYIDVLCAMRCVHLIQVAALIKAEERT